MWVCCPVLLGERSLKTFGRKLYFWSLFPVQVFSISQIQDSQYVLYEHSLSQQHWNWPLSWFMNVLIEHKPQIVVLEMSNEWKFILDLKFAVWALDLIYDGKVLLFGVFFSVATFRLFWRWNWWWKLRKIDRTLVSGCKFYRNFNVFEDFLDFPRFLVNFFLFFNRNLTLILTRKSEICL